MRDWPTLSVGRSSLSTSQVHYMASSQQLTRQTLNFSVSEFTQNVSLYAHSLYAISACRSVAPWPISISLPRLSVCRSVAPWHPASYFPPQAVGRSLPGILPPPGHLLSPDLPPQAVGRSVGRSLASCLLPAIFISLPWLSVGRSMAPCLLSAIS